MILEHSNAATYSAQQTEGVAAVMLLETEGKSNIGADLAHWTIIFGQVTQHL